MSADTCLELGAAGVNHVGHLWTGYWWGAVHWGAGYLEEKIGWYTFCYCVDATHQFTFVRLRLYGYFFPMKLRYLCDAPLPQVALKIWLSRYKRIFVLNKSEMSAFEVTLAKLLAHHLVLSWKTIHQVGQWRDTQFWLLEKVAAWNGRQSQARQAE